MYQLSRSVGGNVEDMEELISLSDYILIGQYVGKYDKKWHPKKNEHMLDNTAGKGMGLAQMHAIGSDGARKYESMTANAREIKGAGMRWRPERAANRVSVFYVVLDCLWKLVARESSQFFCVLMRSFRSWYAIILFCYLMRVVGKKCVFLKIIDWYLSRTYCYATTKAVPLHRNFQRWVYSIL